MSRAKQTGSEQKRCSIPASASIIRLLLDMRGHATNEQDVAWGEVDEAVLANAGDIIDLRRISFDHQQRLRIGRRHWLRQQQEDIWPTNRTNIEPHLIKARRITNDAL